MTDSASESTEDSDGQHDGPHYEEPRTTNFSATGDGSIQFTGGHHGDINQVHASLELSESVARAMVRRSATPPPMNPEALRRLDGLFVPPHRYATALAKLRESSNTVVITGKQGTGRHSAAMKLLSQVAESSHDLSNEAEGEEDLVNPSSVGAREGFLLDLSARSPEAVETLLKRWEPLRARVAAKQCFSVIVLPENTEHLLESDLHWQLVTIGRPDSRVVFERHLAWYGVPYTAADLRSPELLPWLERATMAELSTLARLIHDANATDEGFVERLNQAFAASRTRPEHVTIWLRKHDPEGNERALMLSAAMLAGAHTDAVFAASDTLLNTVDPTENAPNSLKRQGISERLSQINIGVDGRGRVRFDTLDFDYQVRRYFWQEYPGLRDKLREWIVRVAPHTALSERSRNELVFRFAEQALATGRPGDLRGLVEQWGSASPRGPSPAMLGCVALLLRTGLQDERFGGWFRRTVYEWVRSRNTALSPSFDIVLINLCERVIAPSFPDQALVRLRHLARRDDEKVSREAAERIGALAADPSFFRRALYRLTYYLREKEESRDVGLFLRIVDPERLVTHTNPAYALVTDRGARGQLVSGWWVALTQPVSLWEWRVRDWLAVAIDEAAGCTDLTDVLVEASDRNTAVLSRLLGLARRWAHETTGDRRRQRDRVVAELAGRIDASQNLEFLTNMGETAR